MASIPFFRGTVPYHLLSLLKIMFPGSGLARYVRGQEKSKKNCYSIVDFVNFLEHYFYIVTLVIIFQRLDYQ